MNVDIYEIIGSRGHEYIMIEKGVNIDDVLPEELKSKKFKLHKSLTLQPGENKIALDSDEAINSIKLKGYHLQGVQFKAEENIIKK